MNRRWPGKCPEDLLVMNVEKRRMLLKKEEKMFVSQREDLSYSIKGRELALWFW